MLYPMKLSPVFKDYIWGGERLKKEYGKKTDMSPVAESWEVSCHKDGESLIASGPFAGRTLADWLAKEGKGALGTRCTGEGLPILIKLIDAKDNLSVQVHPDEAYAKRVEGEHGKTEMWYIVDAEEGASLLYGFDHEISREEFRRRIEEDTLLDVVHRAPVKKGDVFFIEAGTLHAIGKGILICEIQQSSNTTYRVYDYGRVGKDGKPRALHIEKALDVTRRVPAKPHFSMEEPMDIFDGAKARLLASCDYFTVYELAIEDTVRLFAGEESFQALTVLSGAVTLVAGDEVLSLGKGESAFLPAGLGRYEVTGFGKLLLSKV
nr:type I phosphomannose isomerase catalytic subunit [Mitsuokella multacida]